MHSGDLTELEETGLSVQEREALIQVMERAKQFDQVTAEVMAAPPEGMLLKWTNPINGWKQRWFKVDQQQGVLHYYMSEERKKFPPRGSLHLWGAMVAPSEEDSQSFAINGSSGEIYKLKAVDARERQFWVSRIRREVEMCTNKKDKQSASTLSTPHTQPTPDSPSAQPTTPTRALSKRFPSLSSRLKPPSGAKNTKPNRDEHDGFPGGDAMREVFSRLQCYQENMEMQFDSYSTQSGLDPLDKNVLLLRASSKAAVSSIRDCLRILKQHDPDRLSTTSIGGDVDSTRRDSLSGSPGRHSTNSATGEPGRRSSLTRTNKSLLTTS